MPAPKWIVALVLALVVSLPLGAAQARPGYLKVFVSAYEREYQNKPEAQRCTVCHLAADKKDRNNYGDAIAATLPSRNEKDAAKLEQTLRDVEKLPSAIEGLTFGDLIRAGRLPDSK